LKQNLKDLFSDNALTRFCGLLMKSKVKALKTQYDTSEKGGAPLLGIAKPVIKAHGGSDAKAFMNALKQAHLFASSGVNQKISTQMKAVTDSLAEQDNK
ncbi:MAG: phosphate--acyl-ACP acyltransferase, partial [Clostridia bacterium]|nr:phosphate--acyl-ACP acyltransferase [Clostridia bacterium]